MVPDEKKFDETITSTHNAVDDDDDDDDFQLPTKQTKKQRSSANNNHRLYIGNLPADIEPSQLEQDLLQLLTEKVGGLGNSGLSKQDISVVRSPTTKQKQQQQHSCHAFVTCSSPQDTERVISTLNRYQWYSQRLVVQRDRNNNSNNNKARKGGGNPHSNKPNNKHNNNSKATKGNKQEPLLSSFGAKSSWSKPTIMESQKRPTTTTNPAMKKMTTPQPILKKATTDPNNNNNSPTSAYNNSIRIPPQEEQGATATPTEFLSEMVSQEMSLAEESGDKDQVLNTAMASMAAVSWLSSALEGTTEEDSRISSSAATRADTTDEIASMEDFRTRCQKPLSELLEDYGEEDPNWQQVVPNFDEPTPGSQQSQSQQQELLSCQDDEVATMEDFRARCQKPLSELLTDYGEEDPDWQQVVPTEMCDPTKEKKVSFSGAAAAGDGDDQDNNSNNNTLEEEETTTTSQESRLGRHGKAPIHVELVSFGYVHGAPPDIKRRGWSHTLPLPVVECRDLPEVPGYLVWRDGVSGYVQRILWTEPELREMTETLAHQALEAVQEAINEGDHGYASPLQMKIYVGSEMGRHRSVVVCERAAKMLRNLLRKNEHNLISVPVSIGTLHRDVEQRVHKNKKDGGGGGGRRSHQKQDDLED